MVKLLPPERALKADPLKRSLGVVIPGSNFSPQLPQNTRKCQKMIKNDRRPKYILGITAACYSRSWFSGRGWGQQLSIFRVRRFSEWPEPLHWIAFAVEILTKPLIHWIASPLFTENPFFSLKSASSHPLPKNRLWYRTENAQIPKSAGESAGGTAGSSAESSRFLSKSRETELLPADPRAVPFFPELFPALSVIPNACANTAWRGPPQTPWSLFGVYRYFSLLFLPWKQAFWYARNLFFACWATWALRAENTFGEKLFPPPKMSRKWLSGFSPKVTQNAKSRKACEVGVLLNTQRHKEN